MYHIPIFFSIVFLFLHSKFSIDIYALFCVLLTKDKPIIPGNSQIYAIAQNNKGNIPP